MEKNAITALLALAIGEFPGALKELSAEDFAAFVAGVDLSSLSAEQKEAIDAEQLRRETKDEPGELSVLEARNAELMQDLIEVRQHAIEQEVTIEARRKDLVEARERVTELEATNEALRKDLDARDATIAKLKADKPKAEPRPRGVKARAFKPMDRDEKDRAHFIPAVRSADVLQIIACGERGELLALKPIEAAAKSWREVPAGILFDDRVILEAKENVSITGFALVIDGDKQLAWAARVPVLDVAAGSSINLTGQILF